MRLWVLLAVGVALILAAAILLIRMRSAERRTRRALYRALDISDEDIEIMLTSPGDAARQLGDFRGRELAKDLSTDTESRPRSPSDPGSD